MQDDHLAGKQGNVGEFYICQGNVRDFRQNQENVGKNIFR